MGSKRAGDGVIAKNPPLLTTHTFPPVELDYSIIRPKRVRGWQDILPGSQSHPFFDGA